MSSESVRFSPLTREPPVGLWQSVIVACGYEYTNNILPESYLSGIIVG